MPTFRGTVGWALGRGPGVSSLAGLILAVRRARGSVGAALLVQGQLAVRVRVGACGARGQSLQCLCRGCETGHLCLPGEAVPWAFLELLGMKDESTSPCPPRAGLEDTLSFCTASSLQRTEGGSSTGLGAGARPARGRVGQLLGTCAAHNPSRHPPDSAVQRDRGLAQPRAKHVGPLAARVVAVERALQGKQGRLAPAEGGTGPSRRQPQLCHTWSGVPSS